MEINGQIYGKRRNHRINVSQQYTKIFGKVKAQIFSRVGVRFTKRHVQVKIKK